MVLELGEVVHVNIVVVTHILQEHPQKIIRMQVLENVRAVIQRL